MTFKTKLKTFAVLWIIGLSSPAYADVQDDLCEMYFPGPSWASVAAGDVGMNAQHLASFLSAMRSVGSHTDALIIRNGRIVASTGDPGRIESWASAMKIWLSTLATMMVQKGIIDSLDEKVNFPGLLTKDLDITWRHLMLMSSGYANSESPGQRFAYNDRAISLFVAALQWKLGNNLTAVIKSYLPELALESSNIISSFKASLNDYAKLLQLLLNGGNWDGHQLISRGILKDAFAKIATAPISSSANGFAGYLPIYYFGGGSNQTKVTRFGPGEYVFNGWLNTAGRYGLPKDFFQGNGNWGRTMAAYSPSLRVIVVVRIDGYFPQPQGSIVSGVIPQNLWRIASAVEHECTNQLNPVIMSPMIQLLLL